MARVPLFFVLATFMGSLTYAQKHSYPPVSAYLMDKSDEIALARSAAPSAISDKATVKVLTPQGYEVAQAGDNGSVCMVMRGFTAPTFTPKQFRDIVYDPSVRAPICFAPSAARMVMPYYELRTRLALAGEDPDQIAAKIEEAYVDGTLPQRDSVSFAYMWSADQNLGPGIGAWHPHLMIFAPFYSNSMIGDNPFGSPLPQVTDDAGTPFAVIVVPVEHSLARKSSPHQ